MICFFLFSLIVFPEYPLLALFGKSQRGAQNLIYEGHTFVKDRSYNETINWRCSLFKKERCRARAVTKNIHGCEMMKMTNPTHSHNNIEC